MKFVCEWEFKFKQFDLFCRNTDAQDRYALEKFSYSCFLLLLVSIQFCCAESHSGT